jgi:hypothetical protein
MPRRSIALLRSTPRFPSAARWSAGARLARPSDIFLPAISRDE